MLVLAGGSLFLFNRKSVRFFRKDGHDWRKKSDGKTVRETHEKLKVHSFTDLWLMVVSPVCCGTDCCSGQAMWSPADLAGACAGRQQGRP